MPPSVCTRSIPPLSSLFLSPPLVNLQHFPLVSARNQTPPPLVHQCPELVNFVKTMCCFICSPHELLKYAQTLNSASKQTFLFTHSQVKSTQRNIQLMLSIPNDTLKKKIIAYPFSAPFFLEKYPNSGLFAIKISLLGSACLRLRVPATL